MDWFCKANFYSIKFACQNFVWFDEGAKNYKTVIAIQATKYLKNDLPSKMFMNAAILLTIF